MEVRANRTKQAGQKLKETDGSLYKDTVMLQHPRGFGSVFCFSRALEGYL